MHGILWDMGYKAELRDMFEGHDGDPGGCSGNVVDTRSEPEHTNSVSSIQRGLTLTCSRQPHAIKSGRVMKFHLICQEESANVKRHLIKRGRFFERKPLSNYFKCLRPTHQNIYISVSQRQSVIKLVQHLHSILGFFFQKCDFINNSQKKKSKPWSNQIRC